jgi:cell division protein FtsL
MLQAQSQCAAEWKNPVVHETVRSVRRVKRTTRKENQIRKSIVKAGLILFAYSLLLVYLCIKGASLGYQINSLEKQVKQLEDSNRSIEYQIAKKSSLEAVEQVAVNNLGMYKPDINTAMAVVIDEKPLRVASQPVNTSSKEKQSALSIIYENLQRLARNN